MHDVELNDFIIDIFQDLCEIESIMKVLRESVYNENNGISISDIGNTIEVLVAKTSNIKYSLDKYINTAFDNSL